MFIKPGLQRAVPMGILGFIVGVALVQLIRSLQQMDPLWDPNVIFVVIPFFIVGFFMWGMGAFNPRMSEHAHGPDDAHETSIVAVEGDGAAHEAEDAPGPFALLMSQMWKISFALILIVVILFAFATAPTGLFLRQVNQAEGNVAAVETQQNFLLPLGIDTVQASQLSVFLAFIIFTVLSVVAVAGVIGFLLTFLSKEAKFAEVTESTSIRHHASEPQGIIGIIVRIVGWLVGVLQWVLRGIGGLARGLRRGIPYFFGYRN
ncbi:MAG: hypothetical protein H6670_16425 [Anaerolineaceae bacterium]|nr:hypothetical protein [Anaerolineaceae bacterium]